MPYADFKSVTFGAQDYVGDDHFAMYTPRSLSKILAEAGFTDVEADRRRSPERDLPGDGAGGAGSVA